MKLSVFLLAAGLGLTVAAAPARADDVPVQVQALVAKQAPAVVTVRAVLKVAEKGAAGQGEETRTEMLGVVVDPSGLVMISNLPFSTSKMMEMMGAPAEAADGAPTITPTDFKVIFSNEEKEYPAFLAATDATLGLTFLKIEDLGGRALTSVSFAGAPTPTLGDTVYALSRLSKGYDYAPFYESARISGVIAKPRPALMLDGRITQIGLPVFTLAGEPVGVLTGIASGVSSENTGMSMQIMMRFLTGGNGGGSGVFLVPGSAVGPVIAQAEARAVTLAAQRPPVKPATPTTPAK